MYKDVFTYSVRWICPVGDVTGWGIKKDRPLRKSADSGILSADKGKDRYFFV